MDVGRDSLIHRTGLIHARDVTRTRNISCNRCGTWLIHTRNMTHPCAWRDSHTTHFLQWIWDVTHSYTGHDSSLFRETTRIACNGCGTWLIHTRDMTRRYTTRRIACIWYGTWLNHMRDMINECSWHDSHTLYRLQLMWDVNQSYAGHDSQIHACLIAIDVDVGHDSFMSDT